MYGQAEMNREIRWITVYRGRYSLPDTQPACLGYIWEVTKITFQVPTNPPRTDEIHPKICRMIHFNVDWRECTVWTFVWLNRVSIHGCYVCPVFRVQTQRAVAMWHGRNDRWNGMIDKSNWPWFWTSKMKQWKKGRELTMHNRARTS